MTTRFLQYALLAGALAIGPYAALPSEAQQQQALTLENKQDAKWLKKAANSKKQKGGRDKAQKKERKSSLFLEDGADLRWLDEAVAGTKTGGGKKKD